MDGTPIFEFPQATHSGRRGRLGLGKSKRVACLPEKDVTQLWQPVRPPWRRDQSTRNDWLVMCGTTHEDYLVMRDPHLGIQVDGRQTWEITGLLIYSFFLMWPFEKKFSLGLLLLLVNLINQWLDLAMNQTTQVTTLASMARRWNSFRVLVIHSNLTQDDREWLCS